MTTTEASIDQALDALDAAAQRRDDARLAADHAERATTQAILRAREQGVTVDAIARRLSVSRQAIHKRLRSS